MRSSVAAILVLLPALSLGACESDSSGPSAPLNVVGTAELDASSTSQFVYFNLGSGSMVQVADPVGSSAWDLAVRRYEVRLNGGAVGPKGVSGFNLANNAGATPAQILSYTPENQRAAFEAVDGSAVPAGTAFITETLAADPLGWLSFGAQGPVANAQAAWKLRRSAGGGFALFRVTGLTMAGTSQQDATLATVSVEWRYQPAGGTLGAKQTATLSLTGNTPAIDLSTGTVGAGAGCGWDIKANPDFSLSTNAGCNVGTAPLDVSESFDGTTRADTPLQFGLFLSGLSGAVPFSSALDDPNGPFLYNLAGDNRLSPTYNIYLIRVGDALYKLELTGYYSPTGVSGHPTLRYARIQ